MTLHPVHRLFRALTASAVALATTVAVVAAAMAQAAPAQAANPVTPGNFTGYGFDQCVAPTQKAMNKWLKKSPYLAVGIYISGDSRGCRTQPNLNATWVRKQLKKGWRLLPITLGPQASCHPSFPRYGNDPVINPKPGKGKYGKARKQARAEADKAVAAARSLGIVPGSTLWYDLEGTGPLYTNTACRESSLWFLHAWTKRLHKHGYISGVYSSAGSGIKMLDDARVTRPGTFTLPDAIWIARWDGVANTSTSYIREDGWRPGGRMKQYRGGHLETWGKVTINVDSNYLDLGTGSAPQRAGTACGTKIDFAVYRNIKPAKPRPAQLKALQCLLQQRGSYDGKITGKLNKKTRAAINSFSGRSNDVWNKKDWMRLHAEGHTQVIKRGSVGASVRGLQRALNAAGTARLDITGAFDPATDTALRAYQKRIGIAALGVGNPKVWRSLRSGTRK